jgi:hypothetical protein
MNTRLPLRRCALLLGALCWAVLPAIVYADPGGHAGGGSHGGFGGSHGGASHGGGWGGGSHHAGSATNSGRSSYSYSNPSPRVSVPAHGYYGRGASSPAVSSGVSTNSSRFNSLSNFIATSDANPTRLGAQNPALANLAGHGWHFLPSAGVSRPVTASRAPVRPVRSPAIPAILPFRPHPHRPRLPYATDVILPFYGFGYGGACFFNGFTSVCGASPYMFGTFGANYCLSGIGFYSCGFGGYGLGYGYGAGYGWDWTSYPAGNGEDNGPNNSGVMDIYGGYIGDGTGNAEPNPATPRVPPTQIILKNGSAYEVTAYWVSGGQLYYRPVTGGLSHVPLDELDLSATVQANSRNGVSFTLTDHPPQD